MYRDQFLPTLIFVALFCISQLGFGVWGKVHFLGSTAFICSVDPLLVSSFPRDINFTTSTFSAFEMSSLLWLSFVPSASGLCNGYITT